MCIPQYIKEEVEFEISDPVMDEAQELIEEWLWDFDDPLGTYETEEEEYLERLGFIPDWDNTRELIEGVEQLISEIREQERPISEGLLEEYRDNVSRFREHRLLPRDAYPRISDNQYDFICILYPLLES